MRLRGFNVERGASAVEFAIVASVLLLILFGIIQFGIAYNRVQGLESAGREGARSASIAAPQTDIASRVRSAQSLFTSSDVKVIIDYSIDGGSTWTNVCDDTSSPTCTSSTLKPCGAAGTGNLIRVTGKVPASSKYSIAIPFWANLQITYSGSGIFRCEKTS